MGYNIRHDKGFYPGDPGGAGYARGYLLIGYCVFYLILFVGCDMVFYMDVRVQESIVIFKSRCSFNSSR
jgi:hypothetical protein